MIPSCIYPNPPTLTCISFCIFPPGTSLGFNLFLFMTDHPHERSCAADTVSQDIPSLRDATPIFQPRTVVVWTTCFMWTSGSTMREQHLQYTVPNRVCFCILPASFGSEEFFRGVPSLLRVFLHLLFVSSWWIIETCLVQNMLFQRPVGTA